MFIKIYICIAIILFLIAIFGLIKSIIQNLTFKTIRFNRFVIDKKCIVIWNKKLNEKNYPTAKILYLIILKKLPHHKSRIIKY